MADSEKAAVEHGNGAQQHRAATAGDNPPHYGMSPAKYLATRFTTLKPAMASAPNPLRLLRMLNGQQWAFFTVAFIAWVSNAPRTGGCLVADFAA